MAEMPAIEKNESAKGLSYKFRSINQIINTLQPLMAKHGVTTSIKVDEWKNEFLPDPNQYNPHRVKCFATVLVTVRFYGDGPEDFIETQELAFASDHSDKSATQAMSMAEKYAIVRALKIRTEDMKDPDETAPETTKVNLLPDAAINRETLKKMGWKGVFSEDGNYIYLKTKSAPKGEWLFVSPEQKEKLTEMLEQAKAKKAEQPETVPA